MKKRLKRLGHEYTVELRFYGKNLSVSDISARLELRYTNSLDSSMNIPHSKNKMPFWGYDAQHNTKRYKMWESLEKGFEFVCQKLGPKKDEILSLSREYEAVWWCGHFQSTFDGGPTLTPEFLAEIATYGIPIYLSNYFVSDEQET